MTAIVIPSFGDPVTWEEGAWFLVRLSVILALGRFALAMLAKRATAAARHLVALAALGAALALPLANRVAPAGPTLVVPRSVAPSTAPTEPSRASAAIVTPPVAGEVPSGIGPRRSPPGARLEGVTSRGQGRSARPASWRVLLEQCAALVAAVLLLRIAADVLAALRLFHGAAPVTDARVRASIERVRRRLGVRAPISASMTRRVDIPVVVGLFRPALLLPRHALTWSSERLEAVMIHELAHVRRNDGLTLVFGRVATALLWFHPLAWTLARIARRECERACDDVVLAAGVRASDYAGHLVEIARKASRGARASGLALALARRASLESRVRALLRAGAPRGPASRRTVALVGCLAVLVLVPVASLRVVVSRAGTPSGRTAHPEPPPFLPAGTGAPALVHARNPRAHAGAITSGDARRSALAQYDMLERVRSEDARAWMEVGHALLAVGEPALSADAFERRFEIDQCPGALYQAACALAIGRERARSLSMLERVILDGARISGLLARDPSLASLRGEREYQRLRDLAGELAGGGTAGKAEAAARRAETWRRAVPRFEDVALANPRAGWAWFDLGVAKLNAGDPEAGLAALNRALDLGHHANATMYNLARAAARMNDDDQAEEWLRRAGRAQASVWRRAGCDPDLAVIRSRIARLARGDVEGHEGERPANGGPGRAQVVPESLPGGDS